MRLLAVSLLLSLSSSVSAANCDTDLKQTDTYKQLSAKLKCLNDRINALEGIENTAQKSEPRTKPVAETQVQEADGFRIELESCSKSGGEVACKLFVTSGLRDRSMYITQDSSIVTDDGISLDLVGYHKAGAKDMSRCVGNSIRVDLIAEARSAGVIYFKSAGVISSDLLTTISIKVSNREGVRFKNIRLFPN
jgi:hypothetical protein